MVQDLNSQLLEHESTPVTTRPGLPPYQVNKLEPRPIVYIMQQ